MLTMRRRPKVRKGQAPVVELSPRRLLLDTHVWLWMQADDARLGVRARRMLAHAAEVRFSAASVWEIAIKVAIGKLTLPEDADIGAELRHNGIEALLVDVSHAEHVRRLPLLHRDPFDRLIVAQALVEGLTIMTADTEFAAYGVPVADAAS